MSENKKLQICRACANLTASGLNLFDLKYEDLVLNKVFEKCTSIRLKTRLSSFICEKCLGELMDSYCFIKKCRSSDVELKKFNIQKFICEWCNETCRRTFQAKCKKNCQGVVKDSHKTVDAVEESFNVCEQEIEISCEQETEMVEENHDHYEEEVETVNQSQSKSVPEIEDCQENNCQNFDSGRNGEEDELIFNLDDIDELENVTSGTSKLPTHFCQICDKSFPYSSELERHKKEHRNPFVKLVDLNFDNLLTGSSSKLETSTNKKVNLNKFKHESSSNLECNSTKQENLNCLDLVQAESSEPPKKKNKNKIYQCQKCLGTFSGQTPLNYHMMLHTGEKPFMCEVCGKGFIQKVQYSDHMKNHTGKSSHVCTYCSKSFKSYSSYKYHINTHSPSEAPIPCGSCDKVLRSKNAWKKHQVYHEKKYLCNICGKSFSFKTNLDEHTNVHNGIRPFECDLCDTSFSRKRLLTLHKRKHQEVSQFECGNCDRTFVENHLLLRHQKKAHN